MSETGGRLLRLLSVLQQRPVWRGEELAERVEVTLRTLRRDIERLRHLGYTVEAVRGRYGGYRLAAGGGLPPLLFNDEEAVAAAIALRTAASGAVSGVAESALSALSKLERVLPAQLRSQVGAVAAATISMDIPSQVDAGLLLDIAEACRARERLRIDYTTNSGRTAERDIEPFRLVHTGRRWYLVARDVRLGEWRTYRVDRVESRSRTGHRFEITAPPDAAPLVNRGVAVDRYDVRAVVRLSAPLELAQRRITARVAQLEADGAGFTRMTIGGVTLDWIASYLIGMPFPFEVIEPAELRHLVVQAAERVLQTNRPT